MAQRGALLVKPILRRWSRSFDLDDRAVDLVAEVVAGVEHGGGEVVHAGQAVEALDPVVDGDTGAAQPLQDVPVGGEARVGVEGAGPVGEDGQVPAGGDIGVELAQRPGGGVAGVGEEPLVGLALATVEIGERFEGHEDLAPDLHDVRRRRQLEPPGHRPDREHVGGDVLPRHTVSPGGGPDEMAFFVDEGDGQPVELGLAHEGHRFRHQTLEPLPPRLEVLDIECVIERQHRDDVLDGAEGGSPAGTLGRRVGRYQVGMRRPRGPGAAGRARRIRRRRSRARRARSTGRCGTGSAPGGPRSRRERLPPSGGQYRPGRRPRGRYAGRQFSRSEPAHSITALAGAPFR